MRSYHREAWSVQDGLLTDLAEVLGLVNTSTVEER